ncbi:MAG: GAF domain-containing sensor histidine kinase [Candidatus Dormiibacterota bacterium]
MSDGIDAAETWKQRAKELEALNRAALAIAGDLDLDRVLKTILSTARSLVKARYGALGVPDGHGGFEKFITVGISEKRAREIGDLPRFHGVLGVLLRDGRAIRMPDIRRHPEFSWYPQHHPDMTDFLGVPITHRGATLGEIYLSGNPDGHFNARDQRLVEMLASHAGIAIATASVYSQGQTLAVVEERNRVARELHDAVSQTLFSMQFEAKAAALQARTDPGAAAEALERLQEQAAAALGEMRGLVYALRPKSLERDGLAATLQDHVDALRRSHQADIEVRVEGKPELAFDQEFALLRIAQEALQNAIKHSGDAPITVVLRHRRAGTEMSIQDHGPGFDPEELPRTVRTMGLETMRSRAADINAALTIDASEGDGTTISVFLPATAGKTGG